MKRAAARAFFVFEGVRLVAWVFFLWHMAFSYSTTPGRENEGFIFVHMVALYLGFPYSLLAAYGPDFIHEWMKSGLIAASLLQFLFWFSGAVVTAFVVRKVITRQSRLGPPSKP